MKQRSISALGVGVVGLLPAILGGPVWAVAFAVLCVIGMVEFLDMSRRLSPGVQSFGLIIVPLFALVAWFDCPEYALLGFAALAVFLPIAETTLRKDLAGSATDWAYAAAGTLYLGLPLFAAVSLRRRPGEIDAEWPSNLADDVAFRWDAYPRGLAWLLAIILITWTSDTFAYLVGRQIGKHKFSPVVSPNKSLEGVAGGVIAAAIVGALTFKVFGIDDSIWIGLLGGALLAITGLFGDLIESSLKRQAGVKDSGSIIPGHGGMLDRLDAMLLNFVVGLYLALLVDHFVL
ncbi:MAG: phosphatidate cytidylyltransferase [Thermomicrobiales bacterium]|nr:phosphatidate cytidylyltransferase [Thermomicrobiales bacterium]